uniref:Uncharacterized protein n=1 Tax=Chelonoidis abingdonii TaxID=106734 RepID=A0A8C0GVM7_CHEAB
PSFWSLFHLPKCLLPCDKSVPAPHSSCRALHTSDATPSGHNKWSKVKHIVDPQDAKRSQLFQNLTMLLRFTGKGMGGRGGRGGSCV